MTLGDGSVITERSWELTPGYGRTNVEFPTTTGGFNPDMQEDQYEQLWQIPADDVRRRLTDPHYPGCPLSRFVGNERAKKVMQRAAYAAWGRPNHCCADLSFAMVGPASSGKTTLARLFGETVMLPFIEIPPRGIRDSKEFFDHIAVTLEMTVIDTDTGPLQPEDGHARPVRRVRPDHGRSRPASSSSTRSTGCRRTCGRGSSRRSSPRTGC